MYSGLYKPVKVDLVPSQIDRKRSDHMSDHKNHRRKEKKRKGEKEPRCECSCHGIFPDHIHDKPCCYSKGTWWILDYDDTEKWFPCDPV